MANPALEELRSSLEFTRGSPESCLGQDSNNTIIKLFEDDPRVIEAVIHFFYNLDYPSDLSLIVHHDGPETNGSNGVRRNGTNGVNGDHVRDDSQASVRTEEPSSSLDDFLPINVSKNALKQRKKRAKHRKSLSMTPPDSPGTVTGNPNPEVDAVESREEEGAPLVQRPVAANEPGDDHPPAEDPARQKEGGLVLHAKVYDLSKKLGINSLRALALQKFESETERQWASEDFVKAASEMSSLVTGSEIEEGKIRSIVLNVLCEHRELINNEGMESIIRGMDLAYDLVKQLTQRGLIAM
ncbi:hypothetical protein SLS53_002205 [Cytospora paraplurivora]|uniref:Uncharacterized protein n=1 Tax=Cytospora paraplurivora TaxID=2898453 RepID=A0AAN9UG95_9PEZI